MAEHPGRVKMGSYGPLNINQTLKDKLFQIKIQDGRNATYPQTLWKLIRFYEAHKDCPHGKP
jgi:hypothetical protein